MTGPVIDATCVDEPAGDGAVGEAPAAASVAGASPTSTALAVVQPTGAVIAAERPDEILQKAGEIAQSLKRMIETQGLAVNVGGRRKHVEVGAWQALGVMLGALGGQPLHAETVWTRKVCDADGRPVRTTYRQKVTRYHRKDQGGGIREVVEYDVDGFDWEARVEVRTPAGVVMGSAEAMCSRAEETWSRRDDFAIRSMAETRSESRAFRRAVGWIVNMAGYNPTPAEEMGHTPGAEPAAPPAALAWAAEASPDRKKLALDALERLLGSRDVARAALKAVAEDLGLLPDAVAVAVSRIARAAQEADAAVQTTPTDVPADAPGEPAGAATPPPLAAPAPTPAGPVDARAWAAGLDDGTLELAAQASGLGADPDRVFAAQAEMARRGGTPDPGPQGALPVDRPPAGTVEQPATDGDLPVVAVRKLRAAGCVCPDPLAGGAGLAGGTGLDDTCPLIGHGIAF